MLTQELSSIPRSGLVGEWLLDGSANDTNDGTKNNGTATNVTYVTSDVGYQKQCGSFNGSTSRINCGTSTVHGNSFSVVVYFKRGTPSGENMIVTKWPSSNDRWGIGFTGTTDLKMLIGTDSTWRTIAASTDTNWHMVTLSFTGGRAYGYFDNSAATVDIGTTYSENNSNPFYIGNFASLAGPYAGNVAAVRVYNRVLSDQDRLQLWHEFNRKLGGGSDFGAVIPAPTAHLEAVGEDTFYDVALATKATRTAGSAASDDFGITRAISTPNQSWTSVSGDSFVYWNNSGWKLEKNATGVSATGINTSNTVRAVLFFPAGVISTAQQTYLENCFKRNYPYAFRRSIPAWITDRASFAWYGTTSGSTLYAAKGSNGTLVNTPTKVRSQQWDGLKFVAASSQYANISLPYRTKDQAFTIFWKGIPTNVAQTMGLVRKSGFGHVDAQYHGYGIWVNSSGKLLVHYVGTNGNQVEVRSTNSLVANKECVVCGRKAASSLASGMDVFIDGRKETPVVALNNLSVDAGDGPAYVGYYGGNSTISASNFAALVFTEYLTDQEIQAISQALY
jgi:hypothetical protein